MAAKRSSGPRRSGRPKRTRRTAEEARHAILEATEGQLRRAGPGGIRLQDVAAEVGVSHPTILHHFGSREQLIQAVIERAMVQLEAELLRELAAGEPNEEHAADMLQRVFSVLSDRGYGRIMAWVLLSGHRPRREAAILSIAQALHTRRLADHAERDNAPSFEDSLFTVLCAGLAMFGDAVAGPEMLRSAGLDPNSDAERFRRWFARLLLGHLDAPAEPTPEPDVE